MRRDALYLPDIVEAADAITGFVRESNPDLASEMFRSAIVQKLIVIGEAASRISKELCSRHAEIPWRLIAAFRNILVHEYFGIDWAVVRHAALREAPAIRQQVVAGIAAEFPHTD